MYPMIHKQPVPDHSFERLDQLWERYPKYHEMKTFSTMEELLAEHESWQEALKQRQELDLKKQKLCGENDVRLIEWPYDLDPTVSNLKRILEN